MSRSPFPKGNETRPGNRRILFFMPRTVFRRVKAGSRPQLRRIRLGRLQAVGLALAPLLRHNPPGFDKEQHRAFDS